MLSERDKASGFQFSLRDLLWRKYQRRRTPFEDVQQIDELIANR